MKAVCYLSILLLVFPAGSAWCYGGQEDMMLRIGVSPSAFSDVSRNDALAALKAWAAAVVEEQHLEVPFEISILSNSADEILSALKEGKLSGLSTTVGEYMDFGLKAKDIYVAVTENGYEFDYILIVKDDAGVSSPKELLGRKIAMGKDRRLNLARPWLQTLMADQGQMSERSMLPDLTTVENPSKAILQVFFNQADAALVVEEAYDLACELNPQLRTHLKVVAKSPPFIIGFFILPENFNRTKRAINLEKAILELHTTSGGRQLLTIFKSVRMEKHPISVLDHTIQFLTTYRSLVDGVSPKETPP